MFEKRKRILIVGQNNMEKGGIQNVIMTIVRSLYKEYTFDIILQKKDKGYYDDEFLSYGGKIFYSPTYGGNFIFLQRADFYLRGKRLYRFARKIIKKNGPYAAIHCNLAVESAVFLIAAYDEGVPVRVAHMHGIHNLEDEKAIRQIIDRIYMAEINQYATVRIGCSKQANSSVFGKDVKSFVLNNPYDEKLFDPSIYLEQNKHKYLTITQVGQFCVNKNQIYSIRVLSEIVKLYPDAELCFVGFDQTDYFKDMMRMVKQFGLEANISFFDRDADSPQLLSCSDAFLFPSFSEGFGIALIEAQAMGVRCYVSDTVPRSTDCGGCTYMSLSDGPSAWAERIIEDYECHREKEIYDCSAFKSSEVTKIYKRIYDGGSIDCLQTKER